MADGDVKTFKIKQTADPYSEWNPEFTVEEDLSRTGTGYPYTLPMIQDWEGTCDDPAYYFRRVILFDSLSRSGAVLLEVEGGVANFAWEVSGSGFTLTSTTTSVRYNILTADDTVSNGDVATVTVTDSCGNTASFSSTVYSEVVSCDREDYSFSFGANKEIALGLLDDLHVGGGSGPYLWEVDKEEIVLKNVYTNKPINYAQCNVLDTYGNLTVTDNCGTEVSGLVGTTIPTVNLVVARDGNSTAFLSDTGAIWFKGSFPFAASTWAKIVNNGSIWIALPYSVSGTTTDKFAYSYDGISWSEGTFPFATHWSDIIYSSKGFWIAVGRYAGANYVTSTNGVNWSTRTDLPYVDTYGYKRLASFGGWIICTHTGTGSPSYRYGCYGEPGNWYVLSNVHGISPPCSHPYRKGFCIYGGDAGSTNSDPYIWEWDDADIGDSYLNGGDVIVTYDSTGGQFISHISVFNDEFFVEAWTAGPTYDYYALEVIKNTAGKLWSLAVESSGTFREGVISSLDGLTWTFYPCTLSFFPSSGQGVLGVSGWYTY